jgi:hypothetical protein
MGGVFISLSRTSSGSCMNSVMESDTEDDLSSIPGATTTVVSCKEIEIPGTDSDEAKLMYIHEYDEAAFLSAIEEKFEVVERKEGSKRRRFLVCVLRKKRAEDS